MEGDGHDGGLGARLLDNEGDISSSFDDPTDNTQLEEGVKRRGQSPLEAGSRVFSLADTELVLTPVTLLWTLHPKPPTPTLTSQPQPPTPNPVPLTTIF